MSEAPEKWLCECCGMITGEPLLADSPFDSRDELMGCPHCFRAESMAQACQVGDCANMASGGHPGGYGYRYIWTCWDHRPEAAPVHSTPTPLDAGN